MKQELWKRIKSNDFIVKCTFLVIFISVISCFLTSDTPILTKFNVQKMTKMNTGWVLNGEKKVDLPYSYHPAKNEMLVIESTIPEGIKDDMVIAMQSTYSTNRIYIDGELRYQYGNEKQHSYGRMVGNVYCLAQVHEEDIGKPIRIEITSHYKQLMDIPNIYYGYADNIFVNILHKNLWKILVCVIYTGFIILSLQLCFKQKKNKVKNIKVGMYQSYSIFALFAMIWIVCSSDIPQFFTSKNEAVSFASFISLSFVAVPYCYFCSEIFEEKRRHFLCITYLGCVNTITIIVLFMNGIVDPPETLFITHLYLGLVLVASIVLTIKEKEVNKHIKKMKRSIAVLIVFVILSMVCFYESPTSGNDAIALGIGFTIFSVQLLSINIDENDKVMQELTRLDMYKELAYADKMTHLGNRASFDSVMEGLVQNSKKGEEAILFIFDLNDLKVNNDQFGHHIGDELIIALSDSIQDTFQSIGNSFRIGGDEFATIMIGKGIDAKYYLDKFKKKIEEYNKQSEYHLSVAKGYAKKKVSLITEKTVQEFFDEADQNMYEDKRKMKQIKDSD